MVVVDRADFAEADCLEGGFWGGVVCHIVFWFLEWFRRVGSSG